MTRLISPPPTVADLEQLVEDTLEEPLEDLQNNQQPSTTTRSSRWETRKRVLSPRATAIACIAAALLAAVAVTTVYTQYTVWHTTSFLRATTTSGGAFAKVTQLPNVTATIGGLMTTRDGSLYFSEYADLHSKIGRLFPDRTLAEFPIPSADGARVSEIVGTTGGPDGNLWFAVTNGFAGLTYRSSIIRMTPDGTQTVFPLPSPVGTSRLLFAADGALWFSEGIKLGRMTLDGHVTDYPVEAPGTLGTTGIADMCLGPDGALWYTWFHSNHIGRMTLDGKVQDFAVPQDGVRITTGPDGALWYSESEPATAGHGGVQLRAGFLGRITTAGVASEVPITPSLQIDDMVNGPDGAIWFSAFDQTDSTLKLGHLSARGDVNVYPTQEYGTVSALAAAPGTIWMLNGSENTIWRYRLQA
jgi:virginiamycin B lyase